MASERTIPHLRDVFGLSGYASSGHHRPAGNSDYYRSAAPDVADYRYPQSPQQYQPPQPAPFAHQPSQLQQQHSQQYAQQYQQQQQQQLPSQPPPPHQTNGLPESPVPPLLAQRQPTRKTRRGDNYKTLTPGDVKTLERHLSMKKTIRKKIMRDLQQAFVDDPNEFACDPQHGAQGGGQPRSPAGELNMEAALRFGGAAADAHNLQQSDNFLVMLRADDPTNGLLRGSGGGYGQQQQQQQTNRMTPAGREYDYDAPTVADQAAATTATKEEKPSFWKRLTMKNKTSKR